MLLRPSLRFPRKRDRVRRRVGAMFVDNFFRGMSTAGSLLPMANPARNGIEVIKDVPYRPPLVTPHPHIEGCHTAMVRGPEGEEIHTDDHGRFRVQWHWDREAIGTDEDSRWVRNTQETATGMVLARVGWEQSMAAHTAGCQH